METYCTIWITHTHALIHTLIPGYPVSELTKYFDEATSTTTSSSSGGGVGGVGGDGDGDGGSGGCASAASASLSHKSRLRTASLRDFLLVLALALFLHPVGR